MNYIISNTAEARSIKTIYGIGRNFVKHAEELNNPVPENPIIFLKPLSSICYNGDTVLIPAMSNDVHHEVEVVVAIGKSGKHIDPKHAWGHVEALAVGIDFTARDLQQEAAENGLPWAVAKGFDTFSAISEFHRIESFRDPSELNLLLSVNDEVKQDASTDLMIFDIPSVIHHLSKVVTLQPGDLIFTGTPSGVSKINKGDKIKATLNKYVTLELSVDEE